MTNLDRYAACEEILLGLVTGLTGRVPDDRVDNPPEEITSVEEALDKIHDLYTQV